MLDTTNFHCASITIPLSQIDSPAQLANLLVNVTDAAEEIESEDVSLTVGLLGSVTNSTEDLQQEDVSSRISIYIRLYSSKDVTLSIVEIMHMSFYKIVMQVQVDVLSVVSNMQQVPPEELIASQEKTESSTRFALTVAMYVFLCS